MLTDLPVPTIFAHRGACCYSPENTLAAFELAASAEAPYRDFATQLHVLARR